MAGAEHPTLRVVVLAGGGGTRFWPASRTGTPKQCLRLFGNETLLEATLNRVEPLAKEAPLVVVGEPLADAVAQAAGAKAHRLLLEPAARNTGPAIALAVCVLVDEGCANDTVVVVLPADHFVGDAHRFRDDLRKAAHVARESGDLVVLGVRPTRPETGYGYAEVAGLRADGALSVRQFREKPDPATAAAYLAAGNFYWNVGIFVGTIAAFARELGAHAPDLWRGVSAQDRWKRYGTLRSVPFDVAVLELSQRRALVEATFSWSDVGTWDAVAALLRGDESGNVRIGSSSTTVLFRNARGCLVHADTLRSVGVLGLEGVVVAEKDGHLLVAARGASQSVKHVAEALDAEQDTSTARTPKA